MSDLFFFSGGGMFEVMFFLIFFIVIAMFVFAIVRGIATFSKNNRSPRLTVEAKVVAKRTNVSGSSHAGGTNAMHYTSHTTYYVTFEPKDSDRIELCVDGGEYGMLAEGDVGKLTFQGTRYLGFERY